MLRGSPLFAFRTVKTLMMPDAPDDSLFDALALLVETLPVAVALVDREQRLRYANGAFTRLAPKRADERTGARSDAPGLGMLAPAKIRFVLDTGVALLQQQTADAGAQQGATVSYYPWPQLDGRTLGVLARVDVAPAAPHDLDGSAALPHKLLDVLDQLFAFVGVLELDGTLVHANRAPLEAAGLCLADVRGKLFWDCYWWSHDSAAQDQLRAALRRCRDGEVVRYDAQVRMRDETLLWIDFMLAPLRDDGGRITHLIPSAIDISQRHASESALHRSEQRYQSIVESSDDAIITKSSAGIITGWNAGATRLLGYTADQMIGQPVTLLFPASLLVEETALLERILGGERVASFDTVRLHQDGRLIDVSVTISPLRDRSGTVIGACKIARDISQQKRQHLQAAQALAEKTALLHEVHHRVRNNLQVVTSLLNFQVRGATPETASALAQCQGRIRAMALVHELLYQSESLDEVNLVEYLTRLVALSGASLGIPGSGIALSFRCAERFLAIDIERAVPCGLALHELVSNAFKHAFSQQPGASIEVTLARRADTMLQLSVSDNGRGLPPERVPGLGLQLLPMFVTQMLGSLTVVSSTQGSCFSMTLPGRSAHACQA